MLHKRKLAATAGALAFTLALGACASTGSSSPAATESGRSPELRIGSVTNLTSWAPVEESHANSALLYQAVYDTLLRTEATGEVTAGLATAWEYDEAKTTLTLDLRTDVKFSDGTAFDADVAQQNLLRFRDSASADKDQLSAVQDVTVVDEDTVSVILDAPDPALLTRLSQVPGAQAAPSSFDAEDAQTTPVGSGPYQLDAAASTIGSSYVLTATEGYWDPEIQHYDKVLITYYADASALLNALRDNQVDVSNLNSVTQIPDAESAGYTVNTQLVNWKGLILADRWGVADKQLADVRVRQAINYALDREALLAGVEGGYGEPTTQIFGTETEAYSADLETAYPYDPEKAKELLAEAGYPDGITLTMPQTGFVPPSEPELIAGVLAESNIFIEYEQAGEGFFGELLGGKWAAFSFGLNQEALTWMTYVQAVSPASAWNVYHQSDETVDGLAARIRLGGEDADTASQELNEYLVDQAWFAPFYRVLGAVVTADDTSVTLKTGQGYPNLWDIVPSA